MSLYVLSQNHLGRQSILVVAFDSSSALYVYQLLILQSMYDPFYYTVEKLDWIESLNLLLFI